MSARKLLQRSTQGTPDTFVQRRDSYIGGRFPLIALANSETTCKTKKIKKGYVFYRLFIIRIPEDLFLSIFLSDLPAKASGFGRAISGQIAPTEDAAHKTLQTLTENVIS